MTACLGRTPGGTAETAGGRTTPAGPPRQRPHTTPRAPVSRFTDAAGESAGPAGFQRRGVPRGWRASAFQRPPAPEASSVVPYASVRGSSLRAGPPPRSPVEPSSPDPASSSILFLRGATSRLLEDPAQFVKLPGDATRFPDHVGEGHNLDVPVAPDWNHPALAGADHLDSRHSEARGPDAVGRRRRSASLQMPEHRHAGLKSRLPLDIPGEQAADSPLDKPHVPESVLLGLAPALRLELWDLRALRDHDDAEELAFPT